VNLSPGYGRAAELSINDPRFKGRRYKQLVAAFNVYRVSPIAAESVAPPKIQTAYRGVPLACDASVLAVGESDVTFAIEKLHANAIARSGHSVIMSPLHGMSFQVTPTGVDLEAGRASFSQFITQRRGGAEQRINPRVEPENAIRVRLKCFDRERYGSLHDISVVSLAVSFSETEFKGMRNGDMLTVDIPRLAADGGLSLDAKGKIIRNTPVASSNGDSRDVVIHLQIDHDLYYRLERYVDIRRIATIRELAGAASGANDEDASKPGLALRQPSAI
jgi:hypothetical protein